jgi:hypothetical protein
LKVGNLKQLARMRDSREPREDQARGSSLQERRSTAAGKRPRTKKKPLTDTSHAQRRVKNLKNASMPTDDSARKSTYAREKKRGDRSETSRRADQKSIKQERATKSSKMDNKKRIKSKSRASQSREQPQWDQESSSRNSKAWTSPYRKNTKSITESKAKSVMSSPEKYQGGSSAKSTLSKSSLATQERHASILAMLSDLSDLSTPSTDKYVVVDDPVEEWNKTLLTRALSQRNERQDLPCEETVTVSPKNGTGTSSGSEVVTSIGSTEKLESIRSTLSESAQEPQMTSSLLGDDTLGTISFTTTEDHEYHCYSNFDSGINWFFESTNSVLRYLGVQRRV